MQNRDDVAWSSTTRIRPAPSRTVRYVWVSVRCPSDLTDRADPVEADRAVPATAIAASGTCDAAKACVSLRVPQGPPRGGERLHRSRHRNAPVVVAVMRRARRRAG